MKVCSSPSWLLAPCYCSQVVQRVSDQYGPNHYANAGKHVQLDLHLCSVEEEAKQAMLGQTTQPHLKMMYISTLLDTVFVFCFEQQQLARGATMLAKVRAACDCCCEGCVASCSFCCMTVTDLATMQAISLLAGLVSNNSTRQWWFGTSDLAIFTAAAASFLVDLLDMKMTNQTVSNESPHNYFWWCEGASFPASLFTCYKDLHPAGHDRLSLTAAQASICMSVP